MPRRPRYADVAATLALVLALGGTTAYAVQALPKNSVGKQQLKKDAVTGKKIKNGKVEGEDLAAGTLTSSNLADSSVTSAKIATNGVGPTDLAPNAVGSSELAAGAVGGSKLADGAVTGAKVANNSLSLDDLVGVEVSTTTSYAALAPGTCTALNVPAAGATAGQSALISLNNAVDPGTVVFGPARVTAGAVVSQICNVGNAPVTATGLGIRVVTFG